MDKWRARAYDLLSEGLFEPTLQLAESIESGDWQRLLNQALQGMGLERVVFPDISPRPSILANLRDSYEKLFGGPARPHVLPVESIYRRWTQDPACENPIARQKGFLMADSALHMRALLNAAGIEIPATYRSMPDHLALELSFMAALCAYGTRQQQYRFFQDHLLWVEDFGQDYAGVLQKNDFYAVLLRTVLKVVAHERLYLLEFGGEICVS